MDVAYGCGEFINNLRAKTKYAVDLNPDTRSHLSSSIIFKELSALSIGTASKESADVIFASNFLEHLPDKKTFEIFLDNVWQSLGLTHLSLCEALTLKGVL